MTPADPRPLSVVGPPGLTRDIVTTVLTENGGTVVAPPAAGLPDSGDDCGVPALGSVTVLVEPTSPDWVTARNAGRPIVLVLGDEPTDDEVAEAVLAGADAVVGTSSAPELLAQAIDAVLAGDTLLQRSQVRALVAAARASQHRRGVGLTRRENEIIASIARGDGVKQTARALGIAAKTVENLQSRLFRKLDARNRAHAVVRAHALGLLPVTPSSTPPTAP